MRENLSGSGLTETTLLTLLAFCTKIHGYGAKKWIEEKTNGRVKLGMGTLYGTINNMLEKGYILEHSYEGRKVNYIISKKGIEQLRNERKRIKELFDILENNSFLFDSNI